MSKIDFKKPTICIVTCYRQPDYLRAVTLRQGLKDSDIFSEVIIIKNKHINSLRYIGVLVDLIKVRFTKNPDMYLITFRGYELLPLVLIVGVGKKIIYDEFINPVEWFVYEHKYLVGPLSFLGYLLRIWYSAMMKKTSVVIADTESHAGYSAQLMSIPKDKYFTIPVGADETMFQPTTITSKKSGRPFRVLYYGSMLPLHGISYVLEAAVMMATNKDIEFHIVGGKKNIADMVTKAQMRGANIRYIAWVDYVELPQLFAGSDLCLGGPFGDTVQAGYVITGKTYQFLASARPVLIGHNQETKLFTDKNNALIVPMANQAALAAAIEWAFSHPKELHSIAQNGRKLYEREFSSQRIAGYLRRLFASKRIF